MSLLGTEPMWICLLADVDSQDAERSLSELIWSDHVDECTAGTRKHVATCNSRIACTVELWVLDV